MHYYYNSERAFQLNARNEGSNRGNEQEKPTLTFLNWGEEGDLEEKENTGEVDQWKRR